MTWQANNNSTANTRPLVMMEPDLADWFVGLIDVFRNYVRAL